MIYFYTRDMHIMLPSVDVNYKGINIWIVSDHQWISFHSNYLLSDKLGGIFCRLQTNHSFWCYWFLGNMGVSVSGNQSNYKHWASWRMYVSTFSCNTLYIISLFLHIECFHHSNMNIGHVHTSLYGFIWNRQSLIRTYANWFSLLLHFLRHIREVRVYYIWLISTCFIIHESPRKL